MAHIVKTIIANKDDCTMLALFGLAVGAGVGGGCVVDAVGWTAFLKYCMVPFKALSNVYILCNFVVCVLWK